VGLIFVKETVDRFQRLTRGQSQAAFHKVLTIINFRSATQVQSCVSARLHRTTWPGAFVMAMICWHTGGTGVLEIAITP
jgi:hypothetical protein